MATFNEEPVMPKLGDKMRSIFMRPPPKKADDVFFTSISVLMLVIVLVGFAPSYFLRGAIFAHLPSLLVHLHGAAFSAWIILFVVQSLLVAGGNTHLHRKLGILGGVIAASMVVFGVLAPFGTLRRGAQLPPPFTPASFLVDNVIAILIFGALVGSAIWLRNKTDLHKRLMLVANVMLMPPPLARIPIVQTHGFLIPLTCLSLLAALLVFDFLTQKRPLTVTMLGCVIFITARPAMNLVVQSAFGQQITTWAKHHP